MTAPIRARITLSAIAGMHPGETVWDSAVRGFCVRCRSGGALTYAVKTRVKGRQRWITIGRHGSPWTPDTARKEALRILGLSSKGENLAEQRQAAREEATLAVVVDRFLAIHGPKLKAQTRSDYARILRKDVLPRLGSRRISDCQSARNLDPVSACNVDPFRT